MSSVLNCMSVYNFSRATTAPSGPLESVYGPLEGRGPQVENHCYIP